MGNWFSVDGHIDIVLGLQWGSEGKGQISGALALKNEYDTLISCSGANSGHTWRGEITSGGTIKLVHRHLPLGVISPRVAQVLLGPGAIINPEILIAEVKRARELVPYFDAPVYIHSNACVIYPRHVDEEGGTGVGIGSTMKGNGAAMREKLVRNATHEIASMPESAAVPRGLVPNIAHHCAALNCARANDLGIRVIHGYDYLDFIESSKSALYEGAQGFGLGINSGFYPFVTSRECTPAQMCSDAMIPPQLVRRVIGVVRTYPIRVANRYNDSGEMVGYSGPCYHDQYEISWDDIGVPAEYTTVTKLERRVFTFSLAQIRHAMTMCQPDEIALTFCDYLGVEALQELRRKIAEVGVDTGSLSAITMESYGPSAEDVRFKGGK